MVNHGAHGYENEKWAAASKEGTSLSPLSLWFLQTSNASSFSRFCDASPCHSLDDVPPDNVTPRAINST